MVFVSRRNVSVKKKKCLHGYVMVSDGVCIKKRKKCLNFMFMFIIIYLFIFLNC